MEPAILVWANRNNRPHNLQKQQWDNAKATGLAKGKGKTIENKGRMGMGWYGLGWVYLGGRGNRNLGIENRSRNTIS